MGEINGRGVHFNVGVSLIRTGRSPCAWSVRQSRPLSLASCGVRHSCLWGLSFLSFTSLVNINLLSLNLPPPYTDELVTPFTS